MSDGIDVVVVGAGLSGLVTAHALHRRGLSVRILEASSRAGGVIATREREGFRYETGANSALDNTPAIAELLEELGLGGERVDTAPAAARRYIVRGGRLVALPASPPALIRTRAFGLSAKLRLLCEPFVAPARGAGEESIADFARRRLGREFLDYAVDPFVSGVYAGDPERISAPAAFPRLVALEREHGSLLRGQIALAKLRKTGAAPAAGRSFSFRAGMQALPDALAAHLPPIDFGTRALRIARHPAAGYTTHAERNGSVETIRSRAVVVSVPSAGASALIAPLAGDATAALAAIEYAPVAIVVSAYRREDVGHPLDGFGMLVPTLERRDLLGTLFSSSLFPARAPAGKVLLTTFAGGMRRPELVASPDEALAKRVADQLTDLLGAREPLWQEVVRWERAIPQYTLGHRERIARLDAAFIKDPALRFVANWRGGVAVGDCIANARAAGASLAELLRAG